MVFESDAPEPLVEDVTREISATFGYPGRIVLRSAAELLATWRSNPFAGAPVETLHVYFLAEVPLPSAVQGLDPGRSPGDSFAMLGREIYLQLPQGMARTKLTNAYFDRKLKTVSTARNWNTVGKLVELAGL